MNTNDRDRSATPRLSRRDLLAARIGKIFARSARGSSEGRPTRLPILPSERKDTSQPASRGEVPAGKNEIKGISIAPVGGKKFPAQLASQPQTLVPLFRPPGAIDEPAFLAGCTRCGDCLSACPHDAIFHASERFAFASGTPVLDADRSACMMCADFPCIDACEPRVLTHAAGKVMGTAQITEHLCLAHHGVECTACVEQCPVEEAIELRGEKPLIHEERCTGCGVCRNVCPAPENAVLLMPTLIRPSV